MTTVKVAFSDACSDVLVFLADSRNADELAAYTVADLVQMVAPSDAENPHASVSCALGTLLACGLVRSARTTLGTFWQATAEGCAAVVVARSAVRA